MGHMNNNQSNTVALPKQGERLSRKGSLPERLQFQCPYSGTLHGEQHDCIAHKIRKM